MKKIFTIVILVILTICMTACVKRSIGTEEEKKYFNDFFKSQDEIENPTYVSYYLTYEKDKKTYKYVYTFRYTKQNEIEVRVFDYFDNNYNIYIYDNGKLSHFIYDILPNEYTIPLESEEDIISEEGFKKEYLYDFKYNFDLSTTNYYRKKYNSMHHFDCSHTFIFPKDYEYNINIFYKELKLKKCEFTFETFDSILSTDDIRGIKIVGKYNNIEYTISIQIKK